MIFFKNEKKSEEIMHRGDSSLAVKAGFWYVISIFMVKAIAFITTPIFARLMDKADYGEFSNFASWQLTLLIITSAELYNTVSRAYYDFKEDFNQYLSTITIAGCGLTLLLYILFLLCRGFIFDIVTIPPQYVHLMFIVLFFQAIKQVYFARERTLYKYKTVAAVSFVNLFIPTIISIGLVFIIPNADKLAMRLYGFYIPTAIIGALCAISIFIHGTSFNWKYCRYAFVLAIPLLIHYLTTYLLSSTNIIVTKAVLGAEIAAIVSIANSAIHIVTVFFQSVSGALTTWLMDNLEQRQFGRIKKDSLLYVFLLAISSIGVMLIAPELVYLLGGKKYLISAVLVPGFVFAVFIQAVTTLYTIILTYDKNVVKISAYTTIIAIISIFAKILILKSFSYQSLPLVNIAAFVILFIFSYHLVKTAGYADAIDFKYIIVVICIVGVFSIISLDFYNHQKLRYFIIFLFFSLFAVIGIYNRKKVFTLLKRKNVKNNCSNR